MTLKLDWSQREHGERIARAFHESYEALAPSFGYRTREASAKPWGDVPETNRHLMIATVLDLLDKGIIRAAFDEGERRRSKKLKPVLKQQRLASDEPRYAKDAGAAAAPQPGHTEVASDEGDQ